MMEADLPRAAPIRRARFDRNRHGREAARVFSVQDMTKFDGGGYTLKKKRAKRI
jgi:hypothetical protein